MDEVVSTINVDRDVLTFENNSENNVLIKNFIAQDIRNEMKLELSSRQITIYFLPFAS